MTPQQLFESNRGLVHHIARRYKVPEEDYDDMIQEGYLALWRASLGYDDSKGRFSTYAGSAIEHAYNRYTAQAWNPSGLSACGETIRRAYKAGNGQAKDSDGYDLLRRPALSTEYYVHREDEEGATIADELAVDDQYDFSDDTRRVILAEIDSALDRRARQMLMLRYGLDGHEPMTYEEIGDALGHSRQYINQQVNKALARLRHPRHSTALRDLWS